MLSLWDFSLRFYAMPGVPQACLALQDRHGTDVNLLMFAAWTGCGCGIALSRTDLADIDARVHAWRTEVVQPLRAVRRNLKSTAHQQFHEDASALRQRTKDLELEAERLLQEHLQQLLLSRKPVAQPSLDAALGNLAELLAQTPRGGEPYLEVLQTALRRLHDPHTP
jgi:uncharacterized protein (TIGR02444 family)